MKKLGSVIKTLIFVVGVGVLTGCASIQKDVIMTTDSFVQTEDVLTLEARFTDFDALNILTGSVASDPAVFQQADVLIKDIENCITATGMNEPVVARLYALQGLTSFLQGKNSKAKALYQKSYETNKGDSYTVILGYRLGIVESLLDENVLSGSNQNNLLELEQGLVYYKQGEYAKCVAQLDSAFIDLPEFFTTAYGEIRQKAWNLRNNSDVTDDKTIISILNKSQITVGEMILITQETTDFLYVINGGKQFSETELFSHLSQAGYFSPLSEIQSDGKKRSVKKADVVNRQICARFLWNIYCVKKNLGEQKNKNSKLYRESYGMSPILDVDLFSEDFDAILGTVENEILDLPDGENFMPDRLVAASDFNSYLQKIK